jgi:hypothetical protein
VVNLKRGWVLSAGLLAVFFALGGAVLAAEVTHAHGGGAMPRSVPSGLAASAAFDAAGGLWAVHLDAGRIAVSFSADQGRSWRAPVAVTAEPEELDGGADARPKIALGSRGEVYVTWTRALAKPYTGEVRMARSLDGGRTFSAPSVVHRDRQVITHRFDSLVVTPAGRIVVVWLDKRDQVAAVAAKAPYRGAAVYAAVSEDGGATFVREFKLADHSCECCRVALVAQADETVVAFWRHIFAPNERDHALVRFGTDGSVAPLQRATAEHWRIDACPHHGPALAQDGEGRWHGVWFSGVPGQAGVYYGRIGPAPGPVRRVGGEAAAHADVAAAGRTVVVAWKEFDGERTRLGALVSSDGGETWRERELASTPGNSDHPKVLVHAGRFCVFWPVSGAPLAVHAIP